MKIEKILEEEKQEVIKQQANRDSAAQTGNVPVSTFDSKMNLEETKPVDYVTPAVKAANAVNTTIDDAWTKSKNNTNESREYAATIIKRGDNYVSLEPKEGGKSHSSPKAKKKDLQDGDVVAGDFHTHPYTIEDISVTSGAYNWDGQGTGPSGEDFTGLAQAKVENGYFMIVEAGTVRSIIIIEDVEKYKKAFIQYNGPIAIDVSGIINGEIKDAILTKDYMEKNPEATNPMGYDDAYWIGVINGLKKVKENSKMDDIGLKLLRSKKDNKSEYDTVYP